ncbi:hypothetical protein ECDEC1B_5416 [Escherichia coli DEC1B]|nr:hypothetical protein ECDEC1B_5416 [Escherichia coli DEC1B]
MNADWSYCQARYKKEKSHALFSLLNPWSNEGCFSLHPSPAAPVAVFSPFSGKLLPVCPGRNTGSPSPCFCRFHPASTDLQNNGPASGTLPAPDLTVP